MYCHNKIAICFFVLCFGHCLSAMESDWANKERKKKTEDVSLNFDTTTVYTKQIQQHEEYYQAEVDILIKKFKKKLQYNPPALKTALAQELKNQKKVLENKLKAAKSNVDAQVEAFQEFNRYIVITLNRVDLSATLKAYHEFLKERIDLEKTFIESISSNTLSHLFLERPKKDFYTHYLFKEIEGLRKLVQKVRSYLVERVREKEIFEKKYAKNFRGRYYQIKDKLQKKGKYASK